MSNLESATDAVEQALIKGKRLAERHFRDINPTAKAHMTRGLAQDILKELERARSRDFVAQIRRETAHVA
jgi:hypothetical protein